MAIELYPHNEEAYQKAVRMMQEHGSAVVAGGSGGGAGGSMVGSSSKEAGVLWRKARERKGTGHLGGA